MERQTETENGNWGHIQVAQGVLVGRSGRLRDSRNHASYNVIWSLGLRVSGEGFSIRGTS